MCDSHYTIVVAEEDRACRAFIAENLAADGYRVRTACSPSHAQVLLGERLADLLLVDVNGHIGAALQQAHPVKLIPPAGQHLLRTLATEPGRVLRARS